MKEYPPSYEIQTWQSSDSQLATWMQDTSVVMLLAFRGNIILIQNFMLT